jgi:glutathione-regulated potassium-efflux system ancillary protein KefC
MEQIWPVAALWLLLALVATLFSVWFRISTALSEIVVGTIIGGLIGTQALAASSQWITFLASAGAVILTFLAGAELDPAVFRTKRKEAFAVGLVGFFGPFLGVAAVARYVLHWA